MENLRDRVAVVTGAASGIGKSSALALARAGVHVVIADLQAEAAEEVATEARALGSNAMAARCDVGASDAFKILSAQVLDRYGRVDIVMNNAGVLISGFPEDIPASDWERLMNINFLSMVRSTEVFLPLMLARGEGHFVNTSSFAALFTFSADRIPYGAAKAAVLAMSEGLAYYLRPKGIGVTCLCPGPIMTAIASSNKAWSPTLMDLYAPGEEFEMMLPDAVGDQVVDAIRRNMFLLPTHPHVREKMIRRAEDPDGFLDHQIAHPQVYHMGPQ